MKLFDKISYILLYLLGFSIIGLASLIDPNLGFKELSWSIIVDNALTYVAIICIIIATLLNVVDKFTTTDEEYLASEKAIKDFASSPDYVPSIFSRFTTSINYNRKRKQHEFNIKKKLTYLENHASDKDFSIWNFGTNEEKLNNNYCVKRSTLEYQLSEEWIKKNLHLIDISYDKITSSIILSGVYSKRENNSPNDFITKHKSSKVAREKLPQLLISFAMTLLTSSIVINFIFSSSALLSLITKTGVLCWNTFMTIRYANTWKLEVTLKDIRWRRGILTEYNKWLKEEVDKIKENNNKNIKAVINAPEKDECINVKKNIFNPLSEGLQKGEIQ
jgi:hypothetical protein